MVLKWKISFLRNSLAENGNLVWPFLVTVVLSAVWIWHPNVSWPLLFLKSAYNCIEVSCVFWVIFPLLPSRFSLLSLTLNILTVICAVVVFPYFLIWGHGTSGICKLMFVLKFQKHATITYGNIFSVPFSLLDSN